jgi:hypothetical protein
MKTDFKRNSKKKREEGWLGGGLSSFAPIDDGKI